MTNGAVHPGSSEFGTFFFPANVPSLSSPPVVNAGNQPSEYCYCFVLIAGLYLFLNLEFIFFLAWFIQSICDVFLFIVERTRLEIPLS